MQARTQGLEGLGLPVQDLPKGRGFASGTAGTTEVPGVRVAGNATDLVAQVGASRRPAHWPVPTSTGCRPSRTPTRPSRGSPR
ncbi:hypothetical protein [Amycolatopsis sp.]|uniref:hypothetical protein n=1 Tax=Amycolatopsis sp. TaxID=37632 RepID=UPI002D7E22A6|nr:hypothetical protein [Amycolatopsis sp.]HET6703883.1 hypothetical protein [Amycolatopsis sp.]